MICTYNDQKTEATFKGNYGYYILLQLKWILCVLNILGTEILKHHLNETFFLAILHRLKSLLFLLNTLP